MVFCYFEEFRLLGKTDVSQSPTDRDVNKSDLDVASDCGIVFHFSEMILLISFFSHVLIKRFVFILKGLFSGDL